MKYLKSLIKSLSIDNIDAICKKYGIKNYIINEDESIDVDGDVVLTSKKLKNIPLKFGKVTGGFWCNENELISLYGAPYYVGTGFFCYNNKLTNLEYAPQYVGGYFHCNDNQLTSLKGMPKRVIRLSCFNNNIKNIDYLTNCTIININRNPIAMILDLFDNDIDLIYDFKEREIIQNDILIMDRLVEFLEDIGKPQSKEYLYNLLENEYEIR